MTPTILMKNVFGVGLSTTDYLDCFNKIDYQICDDNIYICYHNKPTMTDTILHLLTSVCPTHILCTETWTKELEAAVSANYVGKAYTRRIKTLCFNLRKNGVNLCQHTAEELATLTTYELAKGGGVRRKTNTTTETEGERLEDSMTGCIEMNHEDGGDWYRSV